MAYGNALRLGENVNPQLMQVDFSPYERAGATTGNALANIGQQVGASIKQYGENEKEIKKAIQISTAIEKGIPGLAPMAQEALGKLSDSNLSQQDRLAIAESIKDSLNIGMTGLQEQRAQEEFNMRKAAASAAASAASSARGAAQAKEIQDAQNLVKGFPSQIAILEASGFNPQAQAFKEQFDLALANGDLNTASTIAGRASGFTASLKPSTLQPVSPTASPQELSASVTRALNLAGANVVQPQNSLITQFNNAIKLGDTKQAAIFAEDINKDVTTQIDQRQKETKENVTLADGTPVLLGNTTGTRYTPTGQPIPSNSEIYNQPIAGSETTIEEKIVKLAEARKLYNEGNKAGALDIMNAIGTSGLFGKTMTMQDLDAQMQDMNKQSGSANDNKLNELKSQF
jgi:hypothetical protein